MPKATCTEPSAIAASDLAPARRGCGAGEQLPAHPGGVQQRTDLRRVLAGEHLGGRHHRGLPAGVGRGGERKRGHCGLAAADVAQQKAVHRPRRGHVRQDLVRRAGLVPCQLERQRSAQGLERPTVHVMRDARTLVHDGVASQGQAHLHAEELLVHEAAPRGLGIGHGLRLVHRSYRPGQRRQVACDPQRGRQEVRHVAVRRERFGDQTPHPPGRESFRRVMHRHDPTQLRPSLVG